MFQKPVVIANADIVRPALKWSLAYLETHIGDGDFSIYVSENHHFKYYDEKKSKQQYFNPPTTRIDMQFSEFVKRLTKANPDRKRLVYDLHLKQFSFCHFDIKGSYFLYLM